MRRKLAGPAGFEPAAFGFVGGSTDRAAVYRNVPERVYPNAYGDAVRQASTYRDAGSRSACHTVATTSAAPVISTRRTLALPAAVSTSARTENRTSQTNAAVRSRSLPARGLVELLRPSQVAAHLGVCRATIYKLIAAGELQHVRVGAQFRIPVAGLASYLARRDESSR